MRFLFLMDPPERIHTAGDTTLALMREAARRGHTLGFAQAWNLFAEGPRVGVEVHDVALGEVPPVQGPKGAHPPGPAFRLGERNATSLGDWDVVLMRHDPPYDERYHLATLLLERARDQTLIVNDPRGLREANEKLYALHFSELMPPTLVSADMAQIRRFQDAQGGELVIKPVSGYAGRGVFHLRHGDRNASALLEMMTEHNTTWLVAQRYLPEAREGDKRILLLGGEPIGAVNRVPSENDLRANMAVGGQAVATVLTERDRAICAKLGPRLRQDGLHFVGIDVIGGYLTEVNVTSPTGIVAANRFVADPLERSVIDWLEREARG